MALTCSSIDPTRSAKPFSRILRCERGVSTLEFALTAPVFLFVTFIILQLGMTLFTQAILDNAARYAARSIRIGTISGRTYSSSLATAICSRVVLVPSCSSSLQIYVAASLSTGASGTSLSGSGFTALTPATISGATMTTGQAALTANDDVLLQVGYYRPWGVRWLAAVAGGVGSMVLATVAFQTEPY